LETLAGVSALAYVAGGEKGGRTRGGVTRRILDGGLGIPAEELNERRRRGSWCLLIVATSQMRNEVWERYSLRCGSRETAGI
jgi:hypothetical protein